VLCRTEAIALREESLCTRLGHACVEGDRCSRKAEPGLSFFFIPRVVNRKAMLAALFAC
jgi:hypothetical protein